MPEGNIGGRYKTIDDADKGIAELDTRLATLQSERDTLDNKIKELTAPRTPKFADDSGADKHITGSADLKDIFSKAIKGETIDNAAYAKIGAAIRDGDDAFIGRSFVGLRLQTGIAAIEKAQSEATTLVGGKTKLDEMIAWHKKTATPEAQAAFAERFNTPSQAAAAVKELLADFTIAAPARGPAELGRQGDGAPPGGPFTKENISAEYKIARGKCGGQVPVGRDPEFTRRWAQTPEDVKNSMQI